MKSLFDLPERLLNKIEPCPTTGCWLWIGALSKNQYGNCWHNNKYRCSHRAVYEEMVGVIDPDLELDHLCRTRFCCNPLHLQPVTPQVNILRGLSPAAAQAKQTHCLRGHPLSGDSLYIEIKRSGREKRHCLVCMKARKQRPEVKEHYRKYRQQKLEAKKAVERQSPENQ